MMVTKPHIEYASSAKKQRPTRLVTFVVFLVPVLIFFHSHLLVLPPSLDLKPCGHIVLVTGARHGSTWFVSCAEGCPSRGEEKFSIPNGRTELWVKHKVGSDIVGDISPESAVDYVRHNMSLKIMRMTANREDELKKFFGLLDSSIPVFVLRRNLEDAYASMLEAMETRVWTKNNFNLVDRVTSRKVVKDEEFFAYKESVSNHFEKMSRFMRKAGIVWDEVDYDEAVRSRTIVGKNQGCYITNCNYL